MSTLEKLRESRIGPYAAFDTLGTLAIGAVYSKTQEKPLLPVLIGLFLLGEGAHILVGQRTPFLNQVLNFLDVDVREDQER